MMECNGMWVTQSNEAAGTCSERDRTCVNQIHQERERTQTQNNTTQKLATVNSTKHTQKKPRTTDRTDRARSSHLS